MGIHYGKADFINYGKPSLLLDFARNKSLVDRISGNNLITFTRSSIGTYVDENGLIKTAAADEPRFDHDPATGESLGLLIEEARTNYYTTSETMLNGRLIQPAQWTWTSFTEGGPQGGSYIRWERIGTVAHPEWNYDIYYNNTGLSIGDKLVVTFYARCPNGTLASIKLSNPDAESEVFAIDSQWRKFTKVFTYGVQGGLAFFRINRGHIPSYVVGTTYDLACLQIEKYQFPTSYIPTSGSTVTRQPDIAQITGTNFTDWFNATEGTFYGSANHSISSTYPRILSADDGFNDQIALMFFDDISQGLGFFVFEDTTEQLRLVSNVQTSSFQQIAAFYSLNNFAASIDGDNVLTSSSGVIPTITQLSIGNRSLNDRYLNGTIKKISYYPTRLTNTQLQQLTQ